MGKPAAKQGDKVAATHLHNHHGYFWRVCMHMIQLGLSYHIENIILRKDEMMLKTLRNKPLSLLHPVDPPKSASEASRSTSIC